MAKFKVGDRVRIIGPEWTNAVGKTGAVWDVSAGNWDDPTLLKGTSPDAIGYRINVDGIGRYSLDRNYIAFEAHELAPLVNPDEESWLEFKKLLQPNPSILENETV